MLTVQDEPGFHTNSVIVRQGETPWPGGLLAKTKQFFLDAANRQIEEAAEVGAIGYLAGICGRAYNVSGTGLNQYVLFFAETGMGKDIISKGTSHLNRAILQSGNNAVESYVGPSELVSAAGLYKWLSRNPSTRIIVNEVGKLYSQLTNPNSHLYGLNRALLQLYTKSGHGERFGAQAYSKKEDVIDAIDWPALTFVGESVGSVFFQNVNDGAVLDGLLPRHLVWEYRGQRLYYNKNASNVQPCPALVNEYSNLASACQTIEQRRDVHNVPFTPDAEAKFDEFDRWTTDTINASQLGVANEFWSRAHLKALKLAGLAAVGENWVQPLITLPLAEWATNLVARQTQSLIARFTNGDVGEEAGNEAKQQAQVVRVIGEYFNADFEKYSVLQGSFEMHRDRVVTEGYVSRRLIRLPTFRNDRLGSTAALKRAIKALLEADELREMPPAQMQQRYGCKPRAFVASNPRRFLETQ